MNITNGSKCCSLSVNFYDIRSKDKYCDGQKYCLQDYIKNPF